ncbi:interferon-induced very large GTPase 1 [Carassius auratus]|uniref:Interferon-induced very large GTPase 1-like n=1 Tax=Carassius auratus TaxID=7957 RepID=A0A6P6NUB0_CARAU|nr:interferon-induced very large GTPase 1-like [Carassius auratus]XP_026112156.1 interferon-induced very large GTPase 1-like [Carassius auratus]
MDCRFPNLTIVTTGNSAAVQFGQDNILLGEEQPNIENVQISRIVPLQRKISEHHVTVINLTGLHETELHLDPANDIIGQLVHENKINTFIFVVRLGQLTDADKMGLEWLQKVFGEEVLQFGMILFTYEAEEECDTITDDLKKNPLLEQLLEKCGGRYHTCSKIMNNQYEMRELMKKIENKRQHYTEEMYNTAREREALQNNECQSDEPAINKDIMDPTTTTETEEKHKITAEEQTTEIEGPYEHGEKEKLTRSKALFLRLHLDKHDYKLTAADVLQLSAHSLQSNESCAEEDLIQMFIHKLLMMDYKARCINVKTDEEGHSDSFKQEADFDDFFFESISDHKSSKTDPIHPMDVQMAAFHCADSFLKQLMVTKLSQCQYALPLLVPDPFTQEIEFPLWTFRQINKSWKMKDADNEIISHIQPVFKAQTPMVSFFRFGSVSSSKSQLMSSLINEKHNTFFHRNCPGSSRARVLMDGVVEITWFCPAGKNTDKFNECVAFCNLHGDAADNEKQLRILTEMASVNVVLLPQLPRNDKRMKQVEKLFNDLKPLICLFDERDSALTETRRGKYKIGLKNRSQSDISEELRRAINYCFSLSSSTFILEDVSKLSDIIVDEKNNDDCRSGKEAAQKMMGLLRNKKLSEIKESVLPHQGKLWHQWCQKNKELHRPQPNELDTEQSKKKRELMKIREQQHEYDISEFIKIFIKETNSGSAKKMFFLKWLGILMDENTSADLFGLHHKYNEQWSAVLKLKENNDKSEQFKTEQTKFEGISEELQAAAFGLEHIMREIGQIYESCISVQKIKEGLEFEISSMPSLAAEMMISGFPLELMDGDAGHVPVIWITAVLDELIKKLGDMRVFVISILGVQSSGKSTMLNAMFGLQFAVSAGRTTRGAFMQLVRVSDEMKAHLNLDYILVVDTEGLRSSEMAVRSTRHRDNEMATFVVGLANLTLINIFGENPAEMQDILQIVVQAFLRMKKVTLNPSCVFVHQNVSDVTAGEKNMEGRRRLQETLDKMTKLAAKEEVYDAECFSDVIEFDIRNDVKYFAQLWEGNPPMAPTNPNYCENIQELKETIMSHAPKSGRMKLIDLKDRIRDLWEALLDERFVFSFQNSLEIAAYRKLETEYNQWSWKLRSAMLEIEYKLHNKIENEEVDEVKESDLKVELKEKSEGVKSSMSEFFEKDTDAGILIQWKNNFEIKIQELQETIIRETNRKLNGMLQRRDLKKKIDSQRTHYENTLFEKSKELALKLKDQAKDEETLKKEFDLFWTECVKKIITDTPIKDIDILREVKLLLGDIYKSAPVDPWREGSECRDVFSLQSYSDYVQLKKSSGYTRHLKNAINAAKKTFGKTLSKEDEIQITIFVTDVAQQIDKRIMSFNIAKMGFNVSCIQQLVDYIKARVREHQEGSVSYVFKNEFSIDFICSIFKRANKTFTQQHRLFREANDPVLFLEKKKEEYYSIFQKHLQGAASSVIFGEILCQKLKERIEQSVYTKSARDLIDDIIRKCRSLNGSRINLEKHILKFLAEKENFSAYMDYINYPREHFENFIRDEVSEYMTHNFSDSVLPKMQKNIELLQKMIMDAVHKSTEHVQTNSGNVDLWLKTFTQQLSDVLIFSKKDLIGVKHDDVDDFNLLKEVITTKLPALMPDTSKESNTDTFYEKLDLKDRPDEILIDQFCQCCWVQCPFCKATCTQTENHDGDHCVLSHRITGINGHYYYETDKLCRDFCTGAVASNKSFKSSGKWIPYKEYRIAREVHNDRILRQVLLGPIWVYWRWFVRRFQKDLENYYEKSFVEQRLFQIMLKAHSKNLAIGSLCI